MDTVIVTSSEITAREPQQNPVLVFSITLTQKRVCPPVWILLVLHAELASVGGGGGGGGRSEAAAGAAAATTAGEAGAAGAFVPAAGCAGAAAEATAAGAAGAYYYSSIRV